MPIAEPMTLATDYVLAALGVWLGRKLWLLGGEDNPRRWWAAGFWAMALAAFLGGSAHGFAPWLGDMAQAVVWRATMVVLGAVAVLLVYAAIRTLGGGAGWNLLLGAEFVIYAVWVCWVDSDFRYAVSQYGIALLVVLVIHLLLAARGRPGAPAVIAGILVSFFAAWIQQAGLSPHPNFNHNDLYHVVQMVGLYLLYRGAAVATATKTGKAT